jgi:hypothetical protein
MSHFGISSFVMTLALFAMNGLCAARVRSENILPREPENDTWSSQVIFNCGERKGTLITSCLVKAKNGLPLCPSQKIYLEGSSPRKTIKYKHEINGGDQEFITEAECFQEKQNYLRGPQRRFENSPETHPLQ